MKLEVVIVGKERSDPILAACDDYLSRLQHYFETNLVVVKEEPERRGQAIELVKRAEAERIRKALTTGGYVIALDERGKSHSSMQLADKLERWRDGGEKIVSFVIGGPSGLDPDFLRSARERWSLSALTLPHRIARLVLTEQLYRAGTILRNEPYHRV